MQPNARSLVYLAAALGSLLFSLWYVHLNEVVNKDGVLYLLAAQGDEDSATALGNWIFYSKLIQGLAGLTGLSAKPAAQVVNALLDLLLVLAFLRLLEELGAGTRALAIGAVAVLVLPYLNDNRAEVIRDHGYWAFSLVALIFYLKLFRAFSWRRLGGWYLAMGLATLFRVEGALFLLLMPLGLLLRPVPFRQRAREVLMAYLPLVAGGLAVAGFLHGRLGDNRLGILLEQASSLSGSLLASIDRRATSLQQILSPYYGHGTALLVIAFAALVDILKDLAKALSWPFLLILLLRRYFPVHALPTDYRRVLAAYVAASALALALHELNTFIMVSRYTMALALALLPVVVLALDELWRRYRAGETGKALPALVMLAVAGLAADSIIESPGHKGYLLEAGRWAATHLPEESRILTDDDVTRLGYYLNGGRPGHRQVAAYRPGLGRLENFDHAMVKNPDGPLAMALEDRGAEEVAAIPRKRGSVLRIYRIPPGRQVTRKGKRAGSPSVPAHTPSSNERPR